jgi:hypothetical protein
MWEEAIVASIAAFFVHLLGSLRKTTKNQSRAWAEI